MTLQEFCDSLPEKKQIELALRFVKIALPIWEEFAKKSKLKYIDSVVGLSHKVDSELLKRTIQKIENNADISELKNIYDEFTDPIVSLQDSDWELPRKVELTFYSVHNLLSGLTQEGNTVFNESYFYVSVNQAIDAITKAKILTRDKIKSIIDEFRQ